LEIILARHAGFCYGVRRALAIAEETRNSYPGVVHTYGPLIHNSQEVERLTQQGIVSTMEVPQEGPLVIRSHGIGKNRHEELKNLCTVVDATCPYVARAQRIAQTLSREGYTVVIYGDPQHAEVTGLLDWCSPSGLVVSGVEEARALEEGKPYALLAQTTSDRNTFQRIAEIVAPKAQSFKMVDTICRATADRQGEARELASFCDVMIVIGGKHSANTNKLFSVIRETNTPVYLIEKAQELKSEWFLGADKIGVTAGASTPDWIIKEVICLMDELKMENEAVLDNEVNEAVAEETPVAEETGVEEQAVEKAETAEEVSAELTMADFDLSSSDENYRVGDIVKAIVVQVGPEEVLVDIGAKQEGVVATRELDNIDEIKPGDELDLMLIRKRNKEGAPVLSKKEIGRRRFRDDRRKQREELAKKFDSLTQSMEEKTEFQVMVTEEVKGGVVVDLDGLRGFVPASHLEIGYVNDLGKYVGQPLRARIIELDKKKNRIVLSQKEILAEEAKVLKEETWARIFEGAELDGVVVRTAKFGAFIDLGGIDGLLHISEMGWNKVEKPEDAVTIGETIRVKVLSVDQESEKIALSLKALQPNPWTVALQNHPEGSIVTGKVLRTTDFGAFVEIEPGFEGLLHISELAYERVEKVEDVVNPGDEVTVKIIKVIPEEKKIGLSIKETLERPAQASRPKKKVAPRAEKKEFQYSTDDDQPLTLGDMFGNLLDKQ